MENEERKERHSRALEPELISDPQKKAEAEALNGLRQYDFAVQLSLTAIERGDFKLRLSQILSLHREALQGISSYAGNFRPGDVEIEGSRHNPVGAHLVPELVEGLCDYVNDHWAKESAVHLASLCDVEVKLDTSVRGRKWPYIPNSFVCRAVGQDRRSVAGHSDAP